MRKHTIVGAAALTVIAVAGCGASLPRAVPASSPVSHRAVPAVATLVPPCLDRINRWFNAGGSMAVDYRQALRDLNRGATLFAHGASGLVEVDLGKVYLHKSTAAFINYEAG